MHKIGPRLELPGKREIYSLQRVPSKGNRFQFGNKKDWHWGGGFTKAWHYYEK